jgi:hypothetical protein
VGPIRVFVSSPNLGLETERAAVKAVLERMRGTEFAGMELFGSRDEDAKTASLEEVEQSHLYVGIIGGRYGSGITRAEYDRARDCRLPCLFYAQNEDAITLRDDDPAAAKAREEWLAEIGDAYDGHLISRFSAPDTLATLVAADVHNWLFRKLADDAKSAAATGATPFLRALLAQTHNTGALRRALLAAGVVASDDLLGALLALVPGTVQQLLEGISDLPTDYAARIENFLIEYLGTPEAPAPFGGRTDVFAELDAWLEHDSAHPYLLIAAEAGRGKTATLVHWTRRHLGDENVEVVFVPVSIRFRTNLAGVFFPALAARLARAHGDDVSADMNLSAEGWRGMVADYLREPLPDGRTLIIVLDGLDEAADWTPGPDLFPRRQPERVRIVASARLTVDLPTSGEWIERLGWSGRTARTLPLPSLTREGVGDVMTSMGGPLAGLGENIGDELHRLSEGDPLLIRLYVEELSERGDEAARLKPEDLATIDPGLEGYFERWWREQKSLWGAASPLKERGVRAVLNLLATAFGPLRSDDILAVAPAESELTTWTLDDAIEPVRRFVIKNDAGFVFSHPRFGQYLSKELTERERHAVDEQFAAWSRGVREQLRDGRLSPADVPPYVVQYSGAHLERMKADVDELCALLTPEWRTAWETTEGGLAGFATDVTRVWRAARAENERLVAAGASPRRLPAEVLCFLLQARIRLLAQRLPASIVGRLLELKLWRPRQAAAYARSLNPTVQRVAILLEAARFSESTGRAALIDEARATIPKLEDQRDQVYASVHLLRAGEPLEPFIEAWPHHRAIFPLWSMSAMALADSGRTSEIVRLSSIEPSYTPMDDLLDRLFDRGQIDEAEEVVRAHQDDEFHDKVYFRNFFWRFAIRGKDIKDDVLLPAAKRMHDLDNRLSQKLPLSLQIADAEWLARLLQYARPSEEIERFIDGLLEAMNPDLRKAVSAKTYDPIFERDPIVECRLGLADARQTIERVMTVRKDEDAADWDVNFYYDLRKTACIANADLIRRGITFAAETTFFRPYECRDLIQHYFHQDRAAARQAIASLSGKPYPYSTFGILAVAAAADPELRDRYVRQGVEILRAHALWSEEADLLVPFMDAASLVSVAEIFTRFHDLAWPKTTRFIFDPRAEALPELASAWQRSDGRVDIMAAAAAAAVVPRYSADVLRAFLRQPPEHNSWLDLFDLVTELLDGPAAIRIRQELWRFIEADGEKFLGELPKLFRAPKFNLVVRLPKQEWAHEETGRILFLPAAERRQAVAELESRHGGDWSYLPLTHVADFLSDTTIATIGETGEPYSLSGVGHRLSEAQARALYERADQHNQPAALLQALLVALGQPEHARALAWLLTPEGLIGVRGLVETVLRHPSLRPEVINELKKKDLVGTAKRIKSSYDCALSVIALCRNLEFDIATARKLALACVDAGHRVTNGDDMWGPVAALRPLLLRSGDETLFPAIQTAVEQAVAVFP